MSDGVEALTFFCTTSRPDDSAILHVLAKRTYQILPTGYCRLSRTQIPLVFEPVDHERPGQGGATAPRVESDAMCNRKPGTDVVIQGKAYAPRRQVSTMDVMVAVTTPHVGASEAWRNATRVRVFGDRTVQRFADGTVSFSAPAPFDTMEISYDRAYGGQDVWGEAKHPDELTEFMKDFSQPDARMESRYAYPRNPAGRGYLVHDDIETADLAELKLPNIEDPGDLLTPARLFARDVRRWNHAPFPAGFDWVDPSWFPRIGHLGFVPEFDGRSEDLTEVRRGLLPAQIVKAADETLIPAALFSEGSDRFCHGASPGLCLPTLNPGASILVSGMHPVEAVLHVRMPAERPRVFIEPPFGTQTELTPALRTAVVDIEEGQLVSVWAASLPLDRPLTETQKQRVRYAVQWPT